MVGDEASIMKLMMHGSKEPKHTSLMTMPATLLHSLRDKLVQNKAEVMTHHGCDDGNTWTELLLTIIIFFLSFFPIFWDTN